MNTCPASRSVDCAFYLKHGYCRCRISLRVSDEELGDSEVIRDIRLQTSGYGLSAEQFVQKLIDDYRDFPGAIVDDRGREVYVPLPVMEDIIRRLDWVRDWACTPPPLIGRLHVRREAWERVRAIATILRAAHPVKAFFWGIRGKKSNDDEPM